MTIEASQRLYISGLNAKVYKFDGIVFFLQFSKKNGDV